MVRDDPKSLDDGGEIPKSLGRVGGSIPVVKSLLFLTENLLGGQLLYIISVGLYHAYVVLSE